MCGCCFVCGSLARTAPAYSCNLLFLLFESVCSFAVVRYVCIRQAFFQLSRSQCHPASFVYVDPVSPLIHVNIKHSQGAHNSLYTKRTRWQQRPHLVLSSKMQGAHAMMKTCTGSTCRPDEERTEEARRINLSVRRVFFG